MKERIAALVKRGKCTISATGDVMHPQAFRVCYTCDPKGVTGRSFV
jgi:hypothetical protein